MHFAQEAVTSVLSVHHVVIGHGVILVVQPHMQGPRLGLIGRDNEPERLVESPVRHILRPGHDAVRSMVYWIFFVAGHVA